MAQTVLSTINSLKSMVVSLTAGQAYKFTLAAYQRGYVIVSSTNGASCGLIGIATAAGGVGYITTVAGASNVTATVSGTEFTITPSYAATLLFSNMIPTQVS